MKTILHIGLHKTGSTFLQKEIFPIIHEREANMNVLCKPRLGLDMLNEGKWEEANAHVQHFKKEHCKEGCVNLISHECLSQDMLLQNHEERFRFISTNFPEAEIIIFLRYQTDWILSVYKELVALGKVKTDVRNFVSLKNGQDRSKNDIPVFEVSKVDYDRMLKNYIDFYGKNRVHVFFYEDLMRDCEMVVQRILNVLNVRNPVTIKNTMRINRSMSALSITLTNILSRFLPLRNELGTSGNWCSVPWYATKGYPWYKRMIIFIQKCCKAIIFWNHWTTFSKGVLDRIVYIDWDLLRRDNLRKRLDECYQIRNKKLKELLKEQTIPELYYSKEKY